MLKARFLGTPQVSFGPSSKTLALTGRIQALFTYLCVTRQPQDRHKLADLLWDNHSDQEAKGNLRYILRDLRKVIGDYLVVEGQTVAFNFDLPHWFDITSFTTYLAPNIRSASSQTEVEILHELLNLYTGDFLSGFYIQDAANFDRWMVAQRRHFHDAMVYGLQLATQQHLEIGEYDAGLALNQYLLTLEPWREEAHRQRMILLAASGQRSAALMQYELCCQILEEELDAPPMNETTSLYSQIKSGLWFVEQKTVETFNSHRVAVRSYPQVVYGNNTTMIDQSETVRPISSNFHVDLGAMSMVQDLFGRRQELCTLQGWLDDDSCRLMAILGLAGQGKSALAARFVQDQTKMVEHTSAEQIMLRAEHRHPHQVKERSSPSSEHQTAEQPSKELVTKIIWRSLAGRPTCVELLQDLLQQLTNKSRSDISSNFDQLATMLFAALQQNRCLIVFDGVESILAHNTHEEQAVAEAYEQLFRLFIERQHRSCLLLTSRIRPSVLTRIQQQKSVVYALELEGLDGEESQKLIEAHGLNTDSHSYRRLHEWYAGNPRMLVQAADLIFELFDGDVDAFLHEAIHFLGDIGVELAQQISHLPLLQKQILHLTAAAEQPLPHQALWAQLPSSPPKEAYYDALRNLQRAYLVRQASGHFTATILPTTFLAEHRTLLCD